MQTLPNFHTGETSVKVKLAKGLWRLILSIFYLQGWHGGYREVAMINPFKLEVLSIGDDFIPLTMYRHEMAHIRQVKLCGRFLFCVRYLYYNIRYGYYNNPFEVEARKYEYVTDYDKSFNI